MQAHDSGALPAGWRRFNGDLPDVNIWLALAQPQHIHHRAATAYWQTTLAEFAEQNVDNERLNLPPARLYFCRTTMLGMVRILSQTSSAYGKPMSLHEAFAQYQSFRLLSEVSFADEYLSDVETSLGELLTAHAQLPVRMATDVYLAAFAQSLNLRLVSFDRDFERFDLPQFLLLQP